VDSITVLQRQDWWKGKLLYKREKKTHNQRGENQPKNKPKNREKKAEKIEQKIGNID
jgi:hypothetical protein